MYEIINSMWTYLGYFLQCLRSGYGVAENFDFTIKTISIEIMVSELFIKPKYYGF